jgi:hypothetical protein
MSPFSNWSSCLTSVEERLAPRSRVFACLDPSGDSLLSRNVTGDRSSAGREELFERERGSDPDFQVWDQCALAL